MPAQARDSRLQASENEVSLFLRKPQALLWGMNKDKCHFDCFWQTFYDYEGTSLSMKLTLPGRWARQKKVDAV